MITIGRSSKCDIIVPHDSVSRIHAHLSVVGGKYVYEDVSKHGSVINGQYMQSRRVTVAPGTEILLAGKVPLPWKQIYRRLPLHGVDAYNAETTYCGGGYQVANPTPTKHDDGIGIGWGILAFFIPLAGWIMYFIWKDDTPRRASQANTIAWIGFILNILEFFATV